MTFNTSTVKELIDRGMPEEALALLTGGSRPRSDDYELVMLEAICHLDIGLSLPYGEEEADGHLNKGIEMANLVLSKESHLSTQQAVQLLLRVSDGLRHKGQILEAASVLERLISTYDISDANMRTVLVRLADLHLRLDKPVDAIRVAERALAISSPVTPNDWGVESGNERAYCLALLVLGYTRCGDQQSALDYLTKAWSGLNSNEPEYSNALYQAIEAELEYLARFVPDSEQRRIVLYTEIIDLTDSRELRAHHLVRLGLVQYNLGQYNNALRSFRRAIEEDPASSIENWGRLYAGMAAYQLNDLKLAGHHFEMPLPSTLTPSEVATYELYRAETFLSLGELKMAKQAYERVAALSEATREQRKLAAKRLSQVSSRLQQ